MSKLMILRKRAKVVALILFFLALAIVAYLRAWWPGIMLALGLPLAIWQFIQGRHYDTAITLFVFVGAFITVQFQIQWEILLPVLFAIGGIYLFFRQWLMNRNAKEVEFEEKKHETDEVEGDDDDDDDDDE